VAVLFYFTAQRESRIVKISPDAQVSHFIDVVGFQWSWQFKYRDAGDFKSATVTGTPAQPPTLYLPQGQKVRFTLDANDVVHGFLDSSIYDPNAKSARSNKSIGVHS